MTEHRLLTDGEFGLRGAAMGRGGARQAHRHVPAGARGHGPPRPAGLAASAPRLNPGRLGGRG